MRIYERNSKSDKLIWKSICRFVDSGKFVDSDRTRGAVTLPSILLISAIIMEIAIVSVIISSALVSSTNNEKLSSEAIKAARAGIEDATIRVVRYCSLSNNADCPSLYSITVGTRTADIRIGILTPTPVGSNFTRTITANATAGLINKRFQAILNIDGATGEVKTQSVKECPYSDTDPASC